MTGLLPFLTVFAYGALCCAVVFTNHQLLKAFLKKRPDLMLKHCPELGASGRHPKKLFFFMRPSTAGILSDDPELLRLRNRLVKLVWCIPIFWVVCLFVWLALFYTLR